MKFKKELRDQHNISTTIT